MLILSRKKNEKIQLGESIQLTIIRVGGDKVRIGIQAPSDTIVLRKELKEEPPEGTASSSETEARKSVA